MRIAIVNPDKCKPKDCNQECKKSCPVVKMGKLCIVVSKKDKIATISEELCNGCNICTKKCPFNAISIINLPSEIPKEVIHRYGENSFQLYRLPVPRMGQVLGLLGQNATGKSTTLKILAGKMTPNLGDWKSGGSWESVLSYYKGSELQNYFTKILEDELKVVIKPQYIDVIGKMVKGGVKDNLDKKHENGSLSEVLKYLELEALYEENRNVSVLSGGELQRFCIAAVCIQKADVYMFDEPSSYLDIKQRINMARCVRNLINHYEGEKKYLICVEHDLSILDYLSDYVSCLYGIPSAYGVVTYPYNVRDGINHFLEGYIPTENMRFRKDKLSFNLAETLEEEIVGGKRQEFSYPETSVEYSSFSLKIKTGTFSTSEITVLLAQNACGKTSFLKKIYEYLSKEENKKVSCKKQMVSIIYDGTVREYLNKKLKLTNQLNNTILKPLQIEELMDSECKKLSGGEMQRVSLAVCLGTEADIYLIDEPSAYLDSEQRINSAKIIKRYIMNNRKCCFIVEHDFIMTCYLADKVICYEGVPGVKCEALPPLPLAEGMNKFLKQLDVTFRRDPDNHRPRINKHGSVKDEEQKREGKYF